MLPKTPVPGESYLTSSLLRYNYPECVYRLDANTARYLGISVKRQRKNITFQYERPSKRSNRCQTCFSSGRAGAITVCQIHNDGLTCVTSLSVFPLQTNSHLQCYYGNNTLLEPACSPAVCYVCHTTRHAQHRKLKEIMLVCCRAVPTPLMRCLTPSYTS